MTPSGALGAGGVRGLRTHRVRRGLGDALERAPHECCRPQEPMCQRLLELAQTRVANGHRRLHVLLRREGWPMNHKRVQRLYQDEELA